MNPKHPYPNPCFDHRMGFGMTLAIRPHLTGWLEEWELWRIEQATNFVIGRRSSPTDDAYHWMKDDLLRCLEDA